jgi:hypothetical protein
MAETSDVRRLVREAIEEAQAAATKRRIRVASATREGERVIRQIATPLFRTIANALKAEGQLFRVDTPTGAVRLTALGGSENFVELALDTARDPPVVELRVNRVRGRRVALEERVVCQDPGIGSLTEDAILDVVMPALLPFLE